MASTGHLTAAGSDVVARSVTLIIGTVVGLTFMFGFGNVLSLGLRLGVPVWVAPLVAPAVDLSILGLLLGIRHLAMSGASDEALRPARRLLMFASAVTLALNVADPVVAGEYGKAAFDAVGPLLLIGWAEVGPSFLRLKSDIGMSAPQTPVDGEGDREHEELEAALPLLEGDGTRQNSSTREWLPDLVLQMMRCTEWVTITLVRARRADARHWVTRRRPICSESLRKELEIGAELARELVAVLRTEIAAKVSASAD